MNHTKRYNKKGDAELWCGERVVAGGSFPQANFWLQPCYCGVDIQTIGTGPETDRVIETRRK